MKRELFLLFAVCVLVTQFCSLCPARIEIDANTVALWLFDEGSGDVLKDHSGNGNNGKVVAAQWVPGKFGSALKFDGIGGKADYVEVAGSESLDLDKALTIEAWVNIEEHQDDNIRIVCAYNAALTAGYSLLMARGGIISDYLHLGGWLQSTGKNPVPTGEWTHLAVTFDSKAGEVKLYMNGELESDGAAAGEITSRGAAPIYIGMSISGAADPETPKGMIDEIRISDVARTQEEIQQTMLGFDLSVEPQSKIATTWGELKGGQ